MRPTGRPRAEGRGSRQASQQNRQVRMSREEFLRSMVIAIVSMALGMFNLYWLVLA
jgi:hypothetical protein